MKRDKCGSSFIYSVEYKCTSVETVITVISMVKDNAERLIPHDSVKRPETTQTPMVAVYKAPWSTEGSNDRSAMRTRTILKMTRADKCERLIKLLKIAKIKKLINGVSTMRYSIKQTKKNKIYKS